MMKEMKKFEYMRNKVKNFTDFSRLTQWWTYRVLLILFIVWVRTRTKMRQYRGALFWRLWSRLINIMCFQFSKRTKMTLKRLLSWLQKKYNRSLCSMKWKIHKALNMSSCDCYTEYCLCQPHNLKDKSFRKSTGV